MTDDSTGADWNQALPLVTSFGDEVFDSSILTFTDDTGPVEDQFVVDQVLLGIVNYLCRRASELGLPKTRVPLLVYLQPGAYLETFNPPRDVGIRLVQRLVDDLELTSDDVRLSDHQPVSAETRSRLFVPDEQEPAEPAVWDPPIVPD